MSKLIGMDKLRNLLKSIKHAGGLRAAAYRLYRFNDLRWGQYVGEDKYGNKYYENKFFFMGRSRWVEYPPNVGTDYDASMVPAEWYGWLHYKTDNLPTKVPPVKYPWMLEHSPNTSGSNQAYFPYSTTRQKIEPWLPPHLRSQSGQA
ncbi:unnamed protein product [Darwinula stevensoni]|uniref:NADH dehydrogenase [ubiquinone] 1 alpha subcomplex subunit 12 n=1 Tax=Darwinula stevensoni TaxID=69355 RepID=A0A7R9FRI6_9CRUS|nr:unnamed protein product [Darwinula stevensoni]CAG0901362.1 unnamed protein product [Darwinula stevensoni]